MGRPKWKTTKIEDDQNGRRPKWKTTRMEDDHNGRQLKCKYASIQVCKYESMQVCLNCAICKVRGKLIVCSLCDIFLYPFTCNVMCCTKLVRMNLWLENGYTF